MTKSTFDKIFEHVLINHRWIFVIFFLLPLSVLYDSYSYLRNFIVFNLRSAPKKHDQRVQKIQRQVKEWKESGCTKLMCTARPGWQTMSFRQGKYKKTHFAVDINLIDILHVDTDKQTVRLEPQVTMGQLTATLLPLGWTLPIVPELDDLTIGGLIMGTGLETSSHKFGLFQHICESFELVLSDASLVKCSADENVDLFHAAPWSYGTIGFLVAAEIKIVPAANFVKLEYFPCKSMDQLVEQFEREVNKKSGNDFVESLVYSKHESVVITGNMTNQATPGQVYKAGSFWSPWYFKHVEDFLHNKVSSYSEFIPIRHYYHRHSRSIFWELQDIIPFGNHPVFRYLLGWCVPPKVSLLKLTQGETVKRFYEEKQMIQDLMVPLSTLKKFLQIFDSEVDIYPMWLCPFLLPSTKGMVDTDQEQPQMYVDIGAYGTPKIPTYNARETTRKLEQHVRDVKGFQMLYADTYMTKGEFRKMFNHQLYDEMRKQLKCEAAFPEVYDKISKDARH